MKEQLKDMLEVINLLKDEQDSRSGQMRAKIEGFQQLLQTSIAKQQKDFQFAIDPLKAEVESLKDKDFNAGKEYEYMLKNATGRMSDEVGKVRDEVQKMKVLNETESLRSNISVLEQEMIDLKNMYRIPLQRGS